MYTTHLNANSVSRLASRLILQVDYLVDKIGTRLKIIPSFVVFIVEVKYELTWSWRLIIDERVLVNNLLAVADNGVGRDPRESLVAHRLANARRAVLAHQLLDEIVSERVTLALTARRRRRDRGGLDDVTQRGVELVEGGRVGRRARHQRLEPHRIVHKLGK